MVVGPGASSQSESNQRGSNKRIIMGRGRTWTEAEKQFVIESYGKILASDIAQKLGKTRNAINSFYYKIGLSKQATNHLLSLAASRSPHPKGQHNPNWRGGKKNHLREYKEQQRKRFPQKWKARVLATSALRWGKLQRQPCEICGDNNAEMHHVDYSKPLEVKWLCRKHHRELHGGLH